MPVESLAERYLSKVLRDLNKALVHPALQPAVGIKTEIAEVDAAQAEVAALRARTEALEKALRDVQACMNQEAPGWDIATNGAPMVVVRKSTLFYASAVIDVALGGPPRATISAALSGETKGETP